MESETKISLFDDDGNHLCSLRTDVYLDNWHWSSRQMRQIGDDGECVADALTRLGPDALRVRHIVVVHSNYSVAKHIILYRITGANINEHIRRRCLRGVKLPPPPLER